MKAIILAAGRGSRLKSMTDEKPKCLVEILGKPLIQWQIESLKKAGLSNIAIVTGYKSELLHQFSDTIFVNSDWLISNMVTSLNCAHSFLLADECVISYSDILYHPDIIRKLSASKADIAITYDVEWYELWKLRFENPFDDAETFKLNSANQLIEIGKKTQDKKDIQGQYMGLLKFTPKGWSSIKSLLQNFSQEQVNKLDMTSLLNLMLQNQIAIATVPVAGHWCEVDNQVDLEIYKSKLIEENWSHDFRS